MVARRGAGRNQRVRQTLPRRERQDHLERHHNRRRTVAAGQPDYAVTVSGGRRNTTWGLSHLETVFGDPLGRGNRYTVQHPTSTRSNNNQSDHECLTPYLIKVTIHMID